MFEPTWSAIHHQKKNKGKIGLYQDGTRKLCRGHKVGFEPTGPRPIIDGCWRCMEKKNGTTGI